VIPSLLARRHAEQLIDAHHGGRLAALVPHLVHRAATTPRPMVELLVALAEIAAEARPVLEPSEDSEEHARYLREAHAAYRRGERYQWVLEGNREYERVRNRRRIARRRAAREAEAGRETRAG
jgi:hypothetical protein